MDDPVHAPTGAKCYVAWMQLVVSDELHLVKIPVSPILNPLTLVYMVKLDYLLLVARNDILQAFECPVKSVELRTRVNSNICLLCVRIVG